MLHNIYVSMWLFSRYVLYVTSILKEFAHLEGRIGVTIPSFRKDPKARQISSCRCSRQPPFFGGEGLGKISLFGEDLEVPKSPYIIWR